MIKYWQSTQDYKYFLNESKVHFISSERNRLHTELWNAWQKLRLFDTDKATKFLLPLYSNTGRPAKNHPQILRSFILFFFYIHKAWQSCPLPFGWTGSDTTAFLLHLLAARPIPCPLSVLILTSWTGSGLLRHRTYTPALNCFLLPTTAKSLTNRKEKTESPGGKTQNYRIYRKASHGRQGYPF